MSPTVPLVVDEASLPEPRLSASEGPLGLLVHRLLYEGVALYSNGQREKAITRWRKVLMIDPKQPNARAYLLRAGEEVNTSDGSVPTQVTLRVQWHHKPSPAVSRSQRRTTQDAQLRQQELYEVLYDRALRALHACAWDLAGVLLETCLHRRPDDDRARRLLDVLHEQVQRHPSADSSRTDATRAA